MLCSHSKQTMHKAKIMIFSSYHMLPWAPDPVIRYSPHVQYLVFASVPKGLTAACPYAHAKN
jgi:hypothetical protein